MENALKMAPTVPVYEEDGETFAGPVGSMSRPSKSVVVSMYHNRNNHLDYWRLFGNAYVELKPVKGLTLRSTFGIDFYSSFINTENSYIIILILSTMILLKQRSHTTMRRTGLGLIQQTSNFTRLADTTSILQCGWVLKSTNRLLSTFSAYSEGYALEDKDYMWPNAATGAMSNSGAKVGYRLASFFGKVNYNCNDSSWHHSLCVVTVLLALVKITDGVLFQQRH